MSSVAISGNASGAGVFTIAAPNSASSFTATLPVATTTLVGTDATQTLTNKTLTTPTIDSASVPTVSGTAPLYFARAWVNFNGTGTPAIRGSGNVTSITDNGTGDYTVVIDVDMPDVNYCTQVTVWNTADNGTSDAYGASRAVVGQVKGASGIAVGSVGVQTTASATDTSPGARVDFSGVFVVIFR